METITPFLHYNKIYLLGCSEVKEACFPLQAKGAMGRGFKPHQRHCVVSLNKTQLSVLSSGSTQEGPSIHN